MCRRMLQLAAIRLIPPTMQPVQYLGVPMPASEERLAEDEGSVVAQGKATSIHRAVHPGEIDTPHTHTRTHAFRH